MPRKAPNNVQEIRITGGTYERNLLAPILEAQKQKIMIQNVRSGIIGLGSIAAFGAVSYFAIQAYGLANGISDELQAFLAKLKETATNVTVGPKSVKTEQPPPPEGTIETDRLFARDAEDPMKRVNPAHGIPAIGPLFGLGMAIGEKFNLPSTDPKSFDIGRYF